MGSTVLIAILLMDLIWQKRSRIWSGLTLKIDQRRKKKILDIYEEVFNHQAFTGRSGTFFGYEGLGSIYWHMVSKLLLAVQECCFKAIERGEKQEFVDRLVEHYYAIQQELALEKHLRSMEHFQPIHIPILRQVEVLNSLV